MEVNGDKMIKVNAIECSNCHDVIYSRAVHDFHYCSCEETFIDGGFDYIRYGGNIVGRPFQIDVNATKRELYDDWNKRDDKFGLIKPKTEEGE